MVDTLSSQEAPKTESLSADALVQAIAKHSAAAAKSKEQWEKEEKARKQAESDKRVAEYKLRKSKKLDQQKRAKLEEMKRWGQDDLKRFMARANYIPEYMREFAVRRGIVADISGEQEGDPDVVDNAIETYERELAKLKKLRGMDPDTISEPHHTDSLSELVLDEDDNALSEEEPAPAVPAKPKKPRRIKRVKQ